MKKIVLNSALVLSVMFLISCDKDFNTLGSDVIGDDHFGLERRDDFNVIAYTKRTGAVQSNNLPTNMLGFYKDDYFGTTKATFVTQLSLVATNPDFGIERSIQTNDSIYLYVPYISTKTETATGIEANTYELGSVFGDMDTSFDLKIFENGYFLRDFDAVDPTVRQKYYSNENTTLIEPNLVGSQLNNSTEVSENSSFKFSNEEIIIYKTDGNGQYLNSSGVVTTVDSERVVKERLAPGMWINLDKTFFETKIINASRSDLLNNNIFKEYFKGLYFQVDANSNTNALALLDFSKGYVTVQYHSKAAETTDELKKKSLKLNLSGNTVNFFENDFSTEYDNKLGASNSTTGDELLYPKGSDGSVVFIDLFGPDTNSNNIPDELEELRAENILLNDAFLTFYVKNNGQKNATRVYLYDATNNTALLDYIFDSSTTANPKNNKFLFGGILEVDENNADLGIKFKIRLTSHINNVINGENENTNKNVRLGLSVTENIANSASYNVLNPISFGNEKLPVGSIINPLGTVVYGNNTTDEAKKLKLEIYYTKPN
ncbi:DUF4270 domain-containing protein [Flavobacterium jejuense]|uniref:DUF4270 domain-containing protein n=1 Tax=Flavobacterium jejuense TaxID=1544455 RepID=A0ABX0IUL4_9FLAO|nr:DUF4270 domain-containing protein [Flavobacterium jejuense]NHN27168.1 DUF4270 domain-containing protein [Flavobacterium jejuense]